MSPACRGSNAAIPPSRRPTSTDSRGTATGLGEFKGHRGPRKAGSRPGTCSGAARSKQFRMQFDYLNIQQSPQTLQFQRCEFVLQTNLGELHATLGEATRQRVTQPLWRRCRHWRPVSHHQRQPEHTTTRAHPGTPGPEATTNDSMSCLREVQTISKSPYILPMPSLTRLTTGGVFNTLKDSTTIGHNELLHQETLQPSLEPRRNTATSPEYRRAGTQHQTPRHGHMTTKRCGTWQQARPHTSRLCVSSNACAPIRRWEHRSRQ